MSWSPSRTVLPVHHLKSTSQSTLHKMCCSQFSFQKPYLILANPFHFAGIEVSDIPVTAVRLQIPKIYGPCHLLDIVRTRRCVWSSSTLLWITSGQLTCGIIWLISTFLLPCDNNVTCYEAFALLDCDAALVESCLEMSRDKLLVPYSVIKQSFYGCISLETGTYRSSRNVSTRCVAT
jgi:hypothetical protein